MPEKVYRQPSLGQTKGQLFTRLGYRTARTLIQKTARRKYIASGFPMRCFFCGYDFHVDIAHRRGVMEFDEMALIDEINHADNLIALCPNHHREADSGIIDLIAAKSLEGHFGRNGLSKKRQFQLGSVLLKERRRGPDVWVFRFKEDGKHKSIVIGDSQKYPTKESAMQAAEELRKAKKKAFSHLL